MQKIKGFIKDYGQSIGLSVILCLLIVLSGYHLKELILYFPWLQHVLGLVVMALCARVLLS